jgi:hypothetical protein
MITLCIKQMPSNKTAAGTGHFCTVKADKAAKKQDQSQRNG